MPSEHRIEVDGEEYIMVPLKLAQDAKHCLRELLSQAYMHPPLSRTSWDAIWRAETAHEGLKAVL